MKVHCEVYGTGVYTGPIIVENDETAIGKVKITIKDTVVQVHARELIKAIQNCTND